MADLNVTYDILVGDQRSAAKLQQNFVDIETKINGNLDAGNIANGTVTSDEFHTALAGRLGVSQTGTVRRGVTVIATEESRSNVAYGTLTTPDVVTGVVLPSAGLLFVGYQASWKNSVAAAGRAAIFLGANQVKAMQSSVDATQPTVQEAVGNTTANTYQTLSTWAGGLARLPSATAYTGDVTTGQILSYNAESNVGGAAVIFAAAGTYDVSVQFRSTSGSVSAKNRNLWVWTMGF